MYNEFICIFEGWGGLMYTSIFAEDLDEAIRKADYEIMHKVVKVIPKSSFDPKKEGLY
jgi:hypothetical protein